MSQASHRNPSLFRTLFLGGTGIAAGASFGFWITGVLPDQTLISFLKYSTVLLGIVWAFSMIVYNKLYDLTELAAIDYKQHRGLESAIRLRLQWFWFRAVVLGICSLIINVPMFMKDGGLAITPAIFSIAFGTLMLSLFLLRRVWLELEDIRELRSEVKEIERREKKRTDQIQALKEGAKNWEDDPRLDNIGPRSETDSISKENDL
ncbi:hypothetical protein A1353_00210 [Methylomonas methanica]|uniref:Uncharacterized protein n=1 Tax=Methylomonas methanica TaxID=421 RepID=A0A177MHL0_METMH|nr:hypothetical protein [Methylomonas methanica]OAI05296.1 hypothetical protein A1353_00210 [Methylomonas methanica]